MKFLKIKLFFYLVFHWCAIQKWVYYSFHSWKRKVWLLTTRKSSLIFFYTRKIQRNRCGFTKNSINLHLKQRNLTDPRYPQYLKYTKQLLLMNRYILMHFPIFFLLIISISFQPYGSKGFWSFFRKLHFSQQKWDFLL